MPGVQFILPSGVGHVSSVAAPILPALCAVLAIVLAMSLASLDPVRAAPPTAPVPPPGACVLVFPLPMRARLLTDFGDRRGSVRPHEGMDLIAPKLTPVFAVASGTITWMHDERGGRCCDVEVKHDDTWSSRYIHLNNDTPGTDDGQGYGIVEDLREGSRVETGQLIGWVGDSGNAEDAGAHLHFELRDTSGRAVNPFEDLALVMPVEERPARRPSVQPVDKPHRREPGLHR